jgi:membrane protein
MSDAVSTRIHHLRAGEVGRGREAKRPADIPVRGWKDILLRVKDEIAEDRIGTIAAGTTFFILLALFPALGALVSLYGLVADPVSIGQHVGDLRGYVPDATLDLIGSELARAAARRTTLGFSFAVSLLVTLWSANSGMKAVLDALNVAYDEKERRGFFRLLMVSGLFTLGGLVFFMVVLNVVIGVPLVLKYLPLGPLGDAVVSILPAVVLFGVAIMAIAVLYRYGPSRTRAQWRWITPGSIATAVVWVSGSALFSYYLSRFADYSATYGSLGAAVGMMMWIYISLWILLVGAELNAEIEHQTARDTTVGPEKPLGARGASMADRIGEPRG